MAAPEETLRAAIRASRARASAVGPLHAAWDTIFDAEALLDGKPMLFDWLNDCGSRENAIKELTAKLS